MNFELDGSGWYVHVSGKFLTIETPSLPKYFDQACRWILERWPMHPVCLVYLGNNGTNVILGYTPGGSKFWPIDDVRLEACEALVPVARKYEMSLAAHEVVSPDGRKLYWLVVDRPQETGAVPLTPSQVGSATR